MVFAFQSSGSLMSNSCRSRFLGMRWDGVMDGATRTTSRSWLKPAPSRFQLHETSPHLDCLLAEPNKQFVPCTLFQCRDDLADAGPCGHGPARPGESASPGCGDPARLTRNVYRVLRGGGRRLARWDR